MSTRKDKEKKNEYEKNKELAWPWEMADEQEEVVYPYSNITTYANFKNGILLTHYEYPKVDGYFKAFNPKTGDEARGVTAADALASLGGWEYKGEYQQSEGFTKTERIYKKGNLTLKLGDDGHSWTATDVSGMEGYSMVSAAGALRSLAFKHEAFEQVANDAAEKVLF
jgi:hypothetical protein